MPNGCISNHGARFFSYNSYYAILIKQTGLTFGYYERQSQQLDMGSDHRIFSSLVYIWYVSRAPLTQSVIEYSLWGQRCWETSMAKCILKAAVELQSLYIIGPRSGSQCVHRNTLYLRGTSTTVGPFEATSATEILVCTHTAMFD